MPGSAHLSSSGKRKNQSRPSHNFQPLPHGYLQTSDVIIGEQNVRHISGSCRYSWKSVLNVPDTYIARSSRLSDLRGRAAARSTAGCAAGGHCSNFDRRSGTRKQSSSERDTLERRKRRSSARLAAVGPLGLLRCGQSCNPPHGILLSRSRRKWRRQSASAGMCTALARTIAQTSSRLATDAPSRSVRPSALFGRGAEDHHDGDRQGILTARSPILPVAASKLAQRNLDAKKPVVRRDGDSRTPESRAKVDPKA
jgi:hypothetical protein